MGVGPPGSPCRRGSQATASCCGQEPWWDHRAQQSVGALDHDTLEILRRRPASFAILAGDDAYIVPTVLMGGGGAIAASAHLCTPTFAAMIDAALAGDVATAVSHAQTLLPVIDAGYAEPNPAGWKAALHALGEIESPAVRPPLTSAPAAVAATLLTAIGNAAPPAISQTPDRHVKGTR